MSRRSSWTPDKCEQFITQDCISNNGRLNSSMEHLGDINMEDQCVTWDLISKTLKQQEQRMKRDVQHIRKKWGNAVNVPKRDVLHKQNLQKTRIYEIPNRDETYIKSTTSIHSISNAEQSLDSSLFYQLRNNSFPSPTIHTVSMNQSSSNPNGSQTSLMDSTSVSPPDTSSIETGSDVISNHKSQSTKLSKVKETSKLYSSTSSNVSSSMDQLKKTKITIRRKNSRLPLRSNKLLDSIPKLNLTETLCKLKNPVGCIARMNDDTLSSSSGGTRTVMSKNPARLEKKRHFRPPRSTSTVIWEDREESDECSSKSSCYFPGSSSIPSSISFSDDTVDVRNETLENEREKLRLEVEKLREEKKQYLAVCKAHEERGKLARERELLYLQRQKLEIQLQTPLYYYTPSGPMNWVFGKSGQ